MIVGQIVILCVCVVCGRSRPERAEAGYATLFPYGLPRLELSRPVYSQLKSQS